MTARKLLLKKIQELTLYLVEKKQSDNQLLLIEKITKELNDLKK